MAQEVDRLSVRRRPAADPDRRERPQRPAHGHPAGRRRHGADRAVERRLPPRAARDADRRGPGLLRRLRRRRARRPGQGADRRVLPRRRLVELPRAATTAGRSTPPPLPGWKFLGYLQDHDQIGNRAIGDRISATLSPGLLAVGAALVLTCPFTPMLFMGEEWGASTPWQFFTSHPEPELGKATAEGRIGEFAEHGWDADDVPDPQDPETFTRSQARLVRARARSRTRGCSTVHRTLLALRQAQPELVDPDLTAVRAEFDEDQRWLVVHRGTLRVVANLSDRPREIQLGPAGHRRRLLHRRRSRRWTGDRDRARGVRGRAQHPLTCGGCCPDRPAELDDDGARRGLPAAAGPVAAGELHRVARRRDHRGRAEQRACGRPATCGSSGCCAPSPTACWSARAPPRPRATAR